ncbi:type II toxin-antitoxin system HicA family toxin [Flammeovirga aprica JL-4]|uniref:Type II toxin-antitoxin system HicA family toxin n=2 Tax=Flammeovirga aprica TaxID=29528 RepID=A0A7X9RZJ5_9BACT|nr:type II toxin-antitoxin system HicA family toxin [Flammeovirga aprica JL-4]
MKVKEFVKLAENVGWTFDRQKGSHMIYTKDGAARPLVIPNHGLGKEIPKALENRLKKQAGITK